jgi:hypothetical protein
MFNARTKLSGPIQAGSGKKRSGAAAAKGRPLGGGVGYTDLARPAGMPVKHLDQLIAALGKARAGDTVYIAGDAVIECTERVFIDQLVLEVPGGVTLASDRGVGGAPGGLIHSDSFATRPLVRAGGGNVRISGIRLQGPNPRPCIEHHTRAFAQGEGREYYYKFPVSVGIQSEDPGLRVDNCELAGWSHSAIHLLKGDGHRVQNNFIHHNQYNGLGYGICHDTAESLIEGNLFDANRHSIAGTGKPGCGYEARHNVEMGRTLSHCFDMHGGRDRKDGTDIAGTWMHIHHNTFRALGRRAVVIRGTPERTALIEKNWFPYKTEERVLQIEGRVEVRDNAWGRTAPLWR